MLGGTGVMGRAIASQLTERKQQVFITSRKEREDKEYLKYITGNSSELTFLKEVLTLANWDCIIDFMVYSTQDFQERAEILLSSTKHYVYLSSARVYSDSDKPITENTSRLLDDSTDVTFLNTDQYPLAKARQENILKASKMQNWTIVRPYITYSSNRLQLGIYEKEEWLYRVIEGKKLVVPECIMNKLTTMTAGTDVANAIVSILCKERAFGEAFHITNNISIKWSDVLTIYLDVIEKRLGFRPQVVYQKMNLFYKYNSVYPIIYDRAFDRFFDNSKISKFVDTHEFIDPAEGLSSSLNEFIQESIFQKINWKSEAYKDKESGEFSSLLKINGWKNRLKYLIFRFN